MKQITGHTGLTGLFGSPVAHSISPMMHNASFEHLGLDYVYLAFDVGTDKLAAAVDGLRAMNVRGFNLTMPDKNKMCELCDRLSPAAEISQAVNTVVNDNGILTGHTTDGTGYLLAAKDAGYDLIGKKMTLLGAGGAATSILVQAALDGLSEISVFSIHDQFYVRAEQIVQTLNERTNCKVQLFDFEDDSILRREIADSYILTNGTSVGMAPNTDASIINDPSFIRKRQNCCALPEKPDVRLSTDSICCCTRGRRHSSCGPGRRCLWRRLKSSIFLKLKWTVHEPFFMHGPFLLFYFPGIFLSPLIQTTAQNRIFHHITDCLVGIKCHMWCHNYIRKTSQDTQIMLT